MNRESTENGRDTLIPLVRRNSVKLHTHASHHWILTRLMVSRCIDIIWVLHKMYYSHTSSQHTKKQQMNKQTKTWPPEIYKCQWVMWISFCCLICIVFLVDVFQLSSHTAVRSFDCILVAPLVKDQDDQKYKKQEAYISDLKSKSLKVTVSYWYSSSLIETKTCFNHIVKHLSHSALTESPPC